MVNGDNAALAGMDVVPGTAPRSLGYDEINKTRDYISAFGVKPGTALPVSRGGTGGITPEQARSNLGAAVYNHNHDGVYIDHGGSDVGRLAIAHGGGRAQLFGGGVFKGYIAYLSDLTKLLQTVAEHTEAIASLREQVRALQERDS